MSSLALHPVITHGLAPVLIERLGRDHGRIAGVVREFSELIDSSVEETDWQRLSELIRFLDYYADRVHHPLEDRLFDHLVNKGLTPTERHLVLKNLGQHQEIKAYTEALDALIGEALKGIAVDPEAFREKGALYVSLQQRHMRFEESHLFPLLDAEFDNRDWNELMGILDQSKEPDQEIHE